MGFNISSRTALQGENSLIQITKTKFRRQDSIDGTISKKAVIVFSAFAQIEGIRVFNLERHKYLYSYALNLSYITMAEENKNIIIYNTTDGKQYQVAFMLY